ncbi:Pr6Pr family membrane protein [Streptomyces sp. HUAS ZL42]|uniref:Pr6Pr family membrane protein n=1 Tax=Streptomyces sp. HUAS ZL42 TaxID=3231715 RepID=UPI00345EED8F
MIAPIPRDIPDLPAVPGRPKRPPSRVPASAVVAPARRPLVAAFRLLTAAAAAGAVAVDLTLGSPLRVLSHFSVQSGILLAVVLALSARRAWTARRPLPSALTGATLLYAVITMLGHHLLPATPAYSITGTSAAGWESLADPILHTAAPVAAILDWLLLTAPDHLHLRQAGKWLLYPAAYLAFTLVRAELLLPGTPGRYLYPLLDVDRHGYQAVLTNALLLSLALYALALLLVALDHTRPNPVRPRPKTGFRLRPPVG